MAHLWRGPNAELKKAYADPLYAAIWRRCGRFGVFGRSDTETGCKVEVYRTESYGKSEFIKIPLGAVSASNPWMAALLVALDFTPFDAELVDLYVTYLERRFDDLDFELRGLLKLETALDELIASVRT